MPFLIDGLQYANWSEKIFRQMREGGVDAVHVTISYHENFRETVLNMERWNRWFQQFPDLIFHGLCGSDVELANETNRTAIFFGFQNPAPIEDDIDLIQILHTLGARFMQLTYNNQSLLATGCYEAEDPGITRMGKQVIKEMNRVGLVVDMSHSSDRSTIEAADISERPIVVSHANPHEWQPALRNKREKVIRALTENGGLLGFSMYPHHLKHKSNCTLNEFCEMIARTGEKYGMDRIGLGSDLCQDHPDSVVEWMRSGRWSKEIDYGEGTKDNAGFPSMPSWFKDNRDFGQIREGLRSTGMSTNEINGVMGDNWHRFFTENFGEK